MCVSSPSTDKWIAGFGRRPGLSGPPLRVRQRGQQGGEFVGRDAAIEHDALDFEGPETPDHLAHRLGCRARQRRVANDHIVADDADGDRRNIGEELIDRLIEPVEGALHERVRRSIELGAA